MRYAICNEMFESTSLAEVCRIAADCGYGGLEIAPFTLAANAFDVSPELRRTTRATVEDSGLEVIGLHWLLAKTEGYYLTTPDESVRSNTADYLCELARLCRDLGGKVLVLGSPQQRNLLPGVTHEQATEFAADCLRLVVPVLESCGVVLAVEPLGPMEGDFLNTADLGVELIHMIDSPAVRLHLDVKAMSTEATPVPAIIEKHASLLEHFHANDPNLLGPGMGEVKFEPIFAALRKINYQGWVSVEVFDFTPGAETIARESIQYMKRCADAAGIQDRR